MSVIQDVKAGALVDGSVAVSDNDSGVKVLKRGVK